MPTYKITAPDGRILRVTGDSPPDETEIEAIFKNLPAIETPGNAVEPPKEQPTGEGALHYYLRTQTPAGLLMDQPASTEREKYEQGLKLQARAAETNADAAAVAGQALAATATAGTIGAAGGVLPAAAGLVRGGIGAYAGSMVGREVGGLVGAPNAGAAIGGIVGGGIATLRPKTMLKLLAGGRRGIVDTFLGSEVSAAERQTLTAATQQRLKLEAEKLAERKAAREAATALGNRRADIAAERNALMRARLEGKAPLRSVNPKPTAVEAPASASEAQPHDFVVNRENADALHETIVQQLQQQMKTTSGRREVNALIAKMKPREAEAVLNALKRGQTKPATVSGPVFGTAEPAGYVGDRMKIRAATASLADLLGQ